MGGFKCVETVPDVGWKSAREKNLYGFCTGERERERNGEENYSVRSLHKAHLLRDV